MLYMEFVSLFDLYESIKKNNNICVKYQPKVHNNSIKFVKIAELHNDTNMFVKHISRNKKELTFHIFLFNSNQLDNKFVCDIVQLNINDKEFDDSIKFSFVSDNTININDINFGKFVVTRNNVIIDEYDKCINNNEIINMLLFRFE